MPNPASNPRGQPQDRQGDCCLCGRPYENWGNNGIPILAHPDYRVCDDCNVYVIQVRLGALKLPWIEDWLQRRKTGG